jgi:hypothetical protein
MRIGNSVVVFIIKGTDQGVIVRFTTTVKVFGGEAADSII